MKTGIMGAMPEEVSELRSCMVGVQSETRGMREYVSGQIHGRPVTVVFSRWGKVAAASTATTLVERYGVERLIFTGVAGAVDRSLKVGDIVIADTLIQHDMDISAISGMERFEVPLLGIARFHVDDAHVSAALHAAEGFVDEDLRDAIGADALGEFGIDRPRVVSGTIASGDRFIADARLTETLRELIPGLQCVEMEGAAVAQVAHEHGIPCLVLRTISDKADHSAPMDFVRFVSRIASPITCGLVLRLLDTIQE